MTRAQTFLSSMILLCFWLPWIGHAEPTAALNPSEREEVLERLGVRDFSLQALSVPSIIGSSFAISVSVHDQTISLPLERASVNAFSGASYILDDGSGLEHHFLPPAPLFRTATRITDESAPIIATGAFLYINGGILGRLNLLHQNGNPAPTETDVFLTPLRWIFPERSFAASAHAIYTRADIVQEDSRDLSCGLGHGIETPITSPNTLRSGGSSSNLGGCSSPPPYVESNIAIVTDYCYWRNMPGANDSERQATAANLVQLSLLDTNIAYAPLGIAHALSTIVFTTTPHSGCGTVSPFNHDTYLLEVERRWPQIGFPTPVDIVSYYVGRQWLGNYLGVAYTPVGFTSTICNPQYFFSTITFGQFPRTSSTASIYSAIRTHHRFQVVAHELGHSWGARHCDGHDPLCGVMSAFFGQGMVTARFDPASTAIVSGEKCNSCLQAVSAPAAPRSIPISDGFNGPLINPATWSHVHQVSQTAQGTIRFNNPSNEQAYGMGYLTSVRLHQDSVSTRDDPKQLEIVLRIRGGSVSTGSVLHVDVLDHELVWRNVFRILPAQLPAPSSPSPGPEFSIPVPLDVFHVSDFRIRLSADLGPGDSIEVDEIALSTRPLRDSVQIPSGKQLLIQDLNGDGVEDLVASEPDQFQGMGTVDIYSRNFGAPRRSLGGATGELFGESIAVIPDMTGDRAPELAVAVPAFYAGFPTGTPRVEIYDGASLLVPGAVTPWRTMNGPPSSQVFGGTGFGETLDFLADATGDGVPDILVGAPREVNPQSVRTGAVHLFSGSTGALVTTVFGENAGDRFGCSLARVPNPPTWGNPIVPGFMVGMCGAPGSFRYTRLYSSRVDSANQLTLLRVDSESAIAHLLPGTQGDTRFGESVSVVRDYDGTARAYIGMPGTRFDTWGVPVSGGAIFSFLPESSSPAPQLITGRAADHGFGSAIGQVHFWEAESPGLVTSALSFLATGGPAASALILRDGFQEVLTLPRPRSPNTSHRMTFANGDLDGDFVPDLVVGIRDPATNPPTSSTSLYLSKSLASPTVTGMGNAWPMFGRRTDFLARPILSVFAPLLSSTTNGVFTFAVRGVFPAYNAPVLHFLLTGSSIAVARSLGEPFATLFGDTRIVVPEFVAEMPQIPYDPNRPIIAGLASENNIFPVNTFSFRNNGGFSGDRYHQVISINMDRFAYDLVRVGNIVKVRY